MHRRIRISVNPAAVPLFFLFLAVLPGGTSAALKRGACLLAAAALHEGAHLGLLACFHVPIAGIRISPGGIAFSCDFSRCPIWAEALIHGAGGIANLLCASVCGVCGLPEAGAAQLLLGLYNLMPLSSFDGGRMLNALFLQLPRGEIWAERAARGVSWGACLLLYAFSGAVFWAGAHTGHGSPLCGALFFSVSAVFAGELAASLRAAGY